MFKRIEILRPLLLILVSLFLGMTGGIVLDRQVLAVFAQPPADPSGAVFDTNLINEAWNLVNRSYVDRPAVKPKDLTYAAISGMLDSLGDTGHTRFLTPEMTKQESNFTRGSFEGIGAEVSSNNGHITIVTPMDGSPAEKAGLKPGDIIMAVDGANVDGQPLSQVISKITGPAGTTVTLTILDPKTNKSRDVTIERARIYLKNVSWQMVPGTKIADVRLAAFSNAVSLELKNALTSAQQQGATAVILDLRNNPGGILDESIAVGSQFLSSGDVLLEKDAQGQTIHMAVRPGGVARDIPLVVLINNGTASAAEIVGGAIQDANRAKLVGEKTFGTGTVLSEFALSDGSAVLLATQEWLTPQGRVIWHQGITPDITVSQGPDGKIFAPDSLKDMSLADVMAGGDTQLIQALELLGVPAPSKP